jgi:uncharacterized membrane protein YqaE (UPF0057 family)
MGDAMRHLIPDLVPSQRLVLDEVRFAGVSATQQSGRNLRPRCFQRSVAGSRSIPALDFFFLCGVKCHLSSTQTSKNILIALLLSILLTFILTIIYALYPIMIALLADGLSHRAGGGGVGAVAGGLGSSLRTVLLLESGLFLIIFALLQRRRVRS